MLKSPSLPARVTVFALLAAVFMLPAMTGCGGYTMRGKVIEGFTPGIYTIDASDSRLNSRGVSEVRIVVYRDPGRLSQELVASGVSGPDGSFAIPLDAFGAGWMEETWMIQTSRRGYRNVETIMKLPSNTEKRPLLIVVNEGHADDLPQQEDLWREAEKYR